MSARFDRDGIGLSYPDNWKLEFEDSDNGWTISLAESRHRFRTRVALRRHARIVGGRPDHP